MSGSIIGSISDRPLQTQQAAKKWLRQIVRERYAAADRAGLKVASDHVMQALEQLPEFIAARCVALYWSLPGEVETHAFAEKWRHEKQVLLPVMHGDGLLLYPFTGREHLVQRRFGVWEPDPEAPFSALPGTPVPDTTSEHTPNCKSLLAAHTTQVPRTNPPQAQPTEPAELTGRDPDPDLIVVPAVGFDPQGSRLGHGKGFYDRLLPGTQALKVGICFDFQLFEHIPAEEHDVPMDRIIAGSRDGSVLYLCDKNDAYR